MMSGLIELRTKEDKKLKRRSNRREKQESQAGNEMKTNGKRENELDNLRRNTKLI